MRTIFLSRPIGGYNSEYARIGESLQERFETDPSLDTRKIDVFDLTSSEEFFNEETGQSELISSCLINALDPNTVLVLFIQETDLLKDLEGGFSKLCDVADALELRFGSDYTSHVISFLIEADQSTAKDEDLLAITSFLQKKFSKNVVYVPRNVDVKKSLPSLVYTNLHKKLVDDDTELSGFIRDEQEAWAAAEEKSREVTVHKALLDSIERDVFLSDSNLTLLRSPGGLGASTLASKLAVHLRDATNNVFISPPNKADFFYSARYVLLYFIDCLERRLNQEQTGRFFRGMSVPQISLYRNLNVSLMRRLARLLDQFKSETGVEAVLIIDSGDRPSEIVEGLFHMLDLLTTRTGLINLFGGLSIRNFKIVAVTNLDPMEIPPALRRDSSPSGPRSYKVPPLNPFEQRAIINGYFLQRGKTVSDGLMRGILNKKGVCQTLYLKILLAGIGMKLDQGEQAALDYINSAPTSLSRLIYEMVRDAVSRRNSLQSIKIIQYLSVTHFGLRHRDLRQLFGPAWSELDFINLLNDLGPLLTMRRDGRIDFANPIIRLSLAKEFKQDSGDKAPDYSEAPLIFLESSPLDYGYEGGIEEELDLIDEIMDDLKGAENKKPKSKFANLFESACGEIFSMLFLYPDSDPVKKDEFLHMGLAMRDLKTMPLIGYTQKVYRSQTLYDTELLANEYYWDALRDYPAADLRAGALKQLLESVRDHALKTGAVDHTFGEFINEKVFRRLQPKNDLDNIYGTVLMNSVVDFGERLIRLNPTRNAFDMLSAAYNRQVIIEMLPFDEDHSAHSAWDSIDVLEEFISTQKVIDPIKDETKLAAFIEANALAVLKRNSIFSFEEAADLMEYMYDIRENLVKWYKDDTSKAFYANSLEVFVDALFVPHCFQMLPSVSRKKIGELRLKYADKALALRKACYETNSTTENKKHLRHAMELFANSCLATGDPNLLFNVSACLDSLSKLNNSLANTMSPNEKVHAKKNLIVLKGLSEALLGETEASEKTFLDGVMDLLKEVSPNGRAYSPLNLVSTLSDWEELYYELGRYEEALHINYVIGQILELSGKLHKLPEPLCPRGTSRGLNGVYANDLFARKDIDIRCHYALGQYEKAIELTLDRLELIGMIRANSEDAKTGASLKRGDFGLIELNLNHLLGELYYQTGRYWDALPRFKKSYENGKFFLNCFNDLSLSYLPILDRLDITRIHAKMGRSEEALKGSQEIFDFNFESYQSLNESGLGVSSEHLALLSPIFYRLTRGKAKSLSGDYAAAKSNLQMAIEYGEDLREFLIDKKVGNFTLFKPFEVGMLMEVEAYLALGEVSFKEGRFSASKHAFSNAVKLCEETKEEMFDTLELDQYRAAALTGVAVSKIKLGEADSVLDTLEQAQEILMKTPEWYATQELLQINSSSLLRVIKEAVKGLEGFQHILNSGASRALLMVHKNAAFLDDKKSREYLAQAYRSCAQLQAASDLPTDALINFRESAAVCKRNLELYGLDLNSSRDYIQSLSTLGDFQFSQSEFTEAKNAYERALDFAQDIVRQGWPFAAKIQPLLLNLSEKLSNVNEHLDEADFS